MTRHKKWHKRRSALTLATALGALTLGATTASAAPTWTETGTSHVNSLTGSQGLASRADGTLVYRGLGSVPLSLRVAGWTHVGDPDVARGLTFDAYQGGDSATKKMFAVTTADGKRTTYEHALDPGEMLNNSFASVSPDDQWLVSGEWGTRDRLQVFPTPALNPSAPQPGTNLPRPARYPSTSRSRTSRAATSPTPPTSSARPTPRPRRSSTSPSTAPSTANRSPAT